jgi:hypothetical protein
MEEHSAPARILRGEAVVGGGIVVRRIDRRAVEVPIPGQAPGLKDVSRRGPTTLQIEEADPGLREELEQLLEIASDIELARQRRGWAPEPVTIEVEGERYKARIDRPINPYGAVESVEFQLDADGL